MREAKTILRMLLNKAVRRTVLRRVEMKTAQLCYVDENAAWFTTNALAKQWGDDWDDVPYEHNAGEPDGPCWHNKPENLNKLSGRGLNQKTKKPLKVGELCRNDCCINDWNDDGTPKFELVKIYWEGPFKTPADLANGNSIYSVEMINKGAIAWLTPSDWCKTEVKPIQAGTLLNDFISQIKLAGGRIFAEYETQT